MTGFADALHLASKVFADAQVVRVELDEACNRLPTARVQVLSSDPDIDLEAALFTSAAVTFDDDLGSEPRVFEGLVRSLRYAGPTSGRHRYELELATFAFPLTLRRGHRIFQKQSTQQIVQQLLDEAGVEAERVQYRLSGRYEQHGEIVQFGETEWAFVERLLADEGITYWFDADDDGKSVLVLGDSPNAHAPIAEPTVVSLVDSGGGAMTALPHLSELEVVEELAHDVTHVREYDVRKPDQLLEGHAGSGLFEWFEFPVKVQTPAAAKRRAEVRLDQLRNLQRHALGKSVCSRLRPGRVFLLSGAHGGDEAIDGEWLVVAVTHLVTRATAESVDTEPYTSSVTLVPHGKRAFRPAPTTTRPILEGFETARTTGPSGEEIHVDDLGAVKVKFHWDRTPIEDDRSSPWVRAVQFGTAASMLLPRVGWEVPVGYLHGDPSRPFVVGRVYNPTTPVPYGLPGAAATATLKSATSPGGGSANEVSMSDDAGKQALAITASRDQTVAAGGDYVRKVGVDENHDVGIAFESNILGSLTNSIGAAASLSTESEHRLSSKTLMAFTFGAVDLLSTKGFRKVMVTGAIGEAVGGAHIIQSNQENLMVTGVFRRDVSGRSLVAAGLAFGETVTGWRKLAVGGSCTIQGLLGVSEESKAVAKVRTGTGRETAGTDVVHKAASAVFDVSGALSLHTSGKLLLAGPKITLKGTSITIDGGTKLEIGGGKVQSSNKVKIKATIKRKQASKTGE